MNIAAACTWRPNGEAARLQAHIPQLAALYGHIAIAVVDADKSDMSVLHTVPRATIVQVPRGQGRHAALQAALTTTATHIHYVDMDRLLRWVETNPTELADAVARIVHTDCLIIGRSERAFASHPHTLQETEKIINMVFSPVLQQPVDPGGGSRGLSRRAAAFVVSHSEPTWWSDAAWPVLLHRGGFGIASMSADGLDWETADRHRSAAADAAAQRQLAEQIDQDARRWAMRVRVAQEIVQEGLAAQHTPLS